MGGGGGVEATHHINYLEMLAVFRGLQTFAKDKTSTHIRIRCDNTMEVISNTLTLLISIINNIDTSHSDACNNLAKTI